LFLKNGVRVHIQRALTMPTVVVEKNNGHKGDNSEKELFISTTTRWASTDRLPFPEAQD
jgi:hypothetical protein